MFLFSIGWWGAITRCQIVSDEAAIAEFGSDIVLAAKTKTQRYYHKDFTDGNGTQKHAFTDISV